jgi:ATP-dependent Clp protease ATP-binding subunit ClpX
LPIVTYLNPLDNASLKRILTEPKNALVKQYTRLFEFDGIKLQVDDLALDFMVEKAVQYKLGGRGLRAICEMILTDAMFDMPSEKHDGHFKLTVEYAKRIVEHTKLEQLKAA